MDLLYQAILDLLNDILPIDYTGSLLDFNEVLAYFLVITLLWVFLLRPLLKLLKVVK